MSKTKNQLQHIYYDLRRCNRDAWRFIQWRKNWRKGYYQLQHTELWEYGKNLLLQLALLKREILICSVCGRPINPRRITLHHRVYNFKKIFDPEYTIFLHKYCHALQHRRELKSYHSINSKKIGNYKKKFTS